LGEGSKLAIGTSVASKMNPLIVSHDGEPPFAGSSAPFCARKLRGRREKFTAISEFLGPQCSIVRVETALRNCFELPETALSRLKERYVTMEYLRILRSGRRLQVRIVQRIRGRRRITFSLTKRGRDACIEARRLSFEVERRMLFGQTKEDRERLASLLDRCARARESGAVT
jgi:hypothetical protein